MNKQQLIHKREIDNPFESDFKVVNEDQILEKIIFWKRSYSQN